MARERIGNTPVSRMPVTFALCCFLFVQNSAAASRTSSAITQADLVRRTQQLYDAVAGGDKTSWNLYLAQDAMVYDEKGRAMNRTAFLDDLQPLPVGYSGVIKLVHPHVTFAAGVAAFAYDLDETETVFGQQMHARYHMVDTWLHRQGKWQIAVSQAMRYYEDPAEGQTNLARLEDLVGTYELSPADHRVISRTGDDLFVKRGEGPNVKLLPESGDLFFRAGVEGRILFHRNASGMVDALYDRRNNEDIIWRKIR